MKDRFVIVEKSGRLRSLAYNPSGDCIYGTPEDYDNVDDEATRRRISREIDLASQIYHKYAIQFQDYFEYRATEFEATRDAYGFIDLHYWINIQLQTLSLWKSQRVVRYYLS